MTTREHTTVDSQDSSAASLSTEQTYVKVRLLGKGAFGEAWLYRKTEENKLVVWKEVNLSKLDERGRNEAHNEIEVLSMLNHPNVVAYYNNFLDGDILLIEMEYANGGSLYSKLGHETQLINESQVVWLLYQCVSALQHIHDQGILHRDIKTLNIFCTKSDLIKLGDFGIAKTLETGDYAETLIGTPYYMSPELVQGKQYNLKSDIWAMGCVLYEMLTLKRTFDATNPLKLASEIVNGKFEDIDPSYSTAMNTMYKSMLQQDPTSRPDADIILADELFEQKPWTLKLLETTVLEINNAAAASRPSSGGISTVPVVTSKTSETFYWGRGKPMPQKVLQLAGNTTALQVAAGTNHLAAVTIEKELYTWSALNVVGELQGQLGHPGNVSCRFPKKVEGLATKAVKQVGCGEDFTAVVTEDAQLYTFGSNYYGCLGQGNNDELEFSDTPLLVDCLSMATGIAVQQVSCGDSHILALTTENSLYSWGCGELGRLGLESEEDFAIPQKVFIKKGKHQIVSLSTGVDNSFLITEAGKVLACGSNEFNKLGINSDLRGLRAKTMTYDVPFKATFQIVKPLTQYDVIEISAGSTHTAVLDRFSQLILFGSNTHGQLGLGDYKFKQGLHILGRSKYLTGKRFDKVACGHKFTIASTVDNEVFSWGNGSCGQLGQDSFKEGHQSKRCSHSSKGPNGFCSATPRPIFGALHAVADVSACNKHTIMIAEQVHNQRTVRSMSSTSSTGEHTLDDIGTLPDCEEVDDEGSEHTKSVPKKSQIDSNASTFCYDWLRAELDEAEFIPVNRDEVDNQATNGKAENAGEMMKSKVIVESESEPTHQCCCSEKVKQLEEYIVQLESKIAKLEKIGGCEAN